LGKNSGQEIPARKPWQETLGKKSLARNRWEVRVMSLTTEIIAALAAIVLVFCLTASSAAFAAGRAARSADGLSCGYSAPQNASPAARCAAIRHQCGGKFWANYCGDRLLSAG
jgi:hypothetical protein